MKNEKNKDITESMLHEIIDDLAFETQSNYSLCKNSDHQYQLYVNGRKFGDLHPQQSFTSSGTIFEIYFQIQDFLTKFFLSRKFNYASSSKEIAKINADLCPNYGTSVIFRYIRPRGLVAFYDSLKSICKKQPDSSYRMNYHDLVQIWKRYIPMVKMAPYGFRGSDRRGFEFRIPDNHGQTRQIVMWYEERLNKDNTPNSSGDILILSPKVLIDFERDIQKLDNYSCVHCGVRQNRLNIICPGCGIDNTP